MCGVEGVGGSRRTRRRTFAGLDPWAGVSSLLPASLLSRNLTTRSSPAGSDWTRRTGARASLARFLPFFIDARFYL
jgi:hypothetical protein